MMQPDIWTSQLRAGKFLLLQDKAGVWLIGSARQAGALEKAVATANLSLADAFVLIDSVDRLYEYVQRFSDLAWDIAEGSEKALLIWYEWGKNVPAAMLDEKGYVGVMLNRCKTLQPLLQKLGHGLLCLKLPADSASWPALPDILPLPQEGAACRLSPERIMRLSEAGDIKFLKY